jgi:3-deoxy-7-phosphoheptulonate synthase
LSAPVGFKNGTDGNVKIAIDAIQAASQSHHFLSIHKNGQVATVQTHGNQDCHLILRGGKSPNYAASHVAEAVKELSTANAIAKVMIDCSHANSDKNHERQKKVCQDIASQLSSGSQSVFGVMIESHLKAGNQKLIQTPSHIATLEYGKSVTDACLGWDDSIVLLDELASAVQARRKKTKPT